MKVIGYHQHFWPFVISLGAFLYRKFSCCEYEEAGGRDERGKSGRQGEKLKSFFFEITVPELKSPL